MINDKYDIETCTWCNGEGIDLSFKGNPSHQPACIRCLGSGKIYVTDEMATTKRRRKYMGPVPKLEVTMERGEITGITFIPESKKRRGRPPKVASGNNPT